MRLKINFFPTTAKNLGYWLTPDTAKSEAIDIFKTASKCISINAIHSFILLYLNRSLSSREMRENSPKNDAYNKSSL